MRELNTTESYYNSMDEALEAIRHAYSDIIGGLTYQGLSRKDTIERANAFVKSTCDKVLSELGLE